MVDAVEFICGIYKRHWVIPFCQTKQSETNGIIDQSLKSNRSDSICVLTEILLSKVGLETRIVGNGTASFCRIGPTGQRGPPLMVTGPL